MREQRTSVNSAAIKILINKILRIKTFIAAPMIDSLHINKGLGVAPELFSKWVQASEFSETLTEFSQGFFAVLTATNKFQEYRHAIMGELDENLASRLIIAERNPTKSKSTEIEGSDQELVDSIAEDKDHLIRLKKFIEKQNASIKSQGTAKYSDDSKSIGHDTIAVEIESLAKGKMNGLIYGETNKLKDLLEQNPEIFHFLDKNIDKLMDAEQAWQQDLDELKFNSPKDEIATSKIKIVSYLEKIEPRIASYLEKIEQEFAAENLNLILNDFKKNPEAALAQHNNKLNLLISMNIRLKLLIGERINKCVTDARKVGKYLEKFKSYQNRAKELLGKFKGQMQMIAINKVAQIFNSEYQASPSDLLGVKKYFAMNNIHRGPAREERFLELIGQALTTNTPLQLNTTDYGLIEWLRDTIIKKAHLTHLDLSKLNIAKSLLKGLLIDVDPKIKKLTLPKMEFSFTEALKLMESTLKYNTNIKEIKFPTDVCINTSDEAKQLLAFVAKHGNIINLSGFTMQLPSRIFDTNCISERNVLKTIHEIFQHRNEVAGTIEWVGTITDDGINLSSQSLDASDLVLVAKLVNENIVSLDLSNNQIAKSSDGQHSSIGINAIAKLIEDNQHITTVNLAGNSLQNQDVDRLIEAVANSKVTKLDIDTTDIDPHYVGLLNSKLEVNRSCLKVVWKTIGY